MAPSNDPAGTVGANGIADPTGTGKTAAGGSTGNKGRLATRALAVALATCMKEGCPVTCADSLPIDSVSESHGLGKSMRARRTMMAATTHEQ